MNSTPLFLFYLVFLLNFALSHILFTPFFLVEAEVTRVTGMTGMTRTSGMYMKAKLTEVTTLGYTRR